MASTEQDTERAEPLVNSVDRGVFHAHDIDDDPPIIDSDDLSVSVAENLAARVLTAAGSLARRITRVVQGDAAVWWMPNGEIVVTTPRNATAEEITAMQGARAAFKDEVMALATLAAKYSSARVNVPSSLHAAVLRLAADQNEFEDVQAAVGKAIEAWRALDALSGRTRAAVAARLVAGGMTATAADKAASGDPEYTDLKDRIAEAANSREACERSRDVARERLATSRALLYAWSPILVSDSSA